MAAIDPFRLDAILGDKAQPSDVFGLNRVLGKPREPEGLGSALSRGFVEAAQQVPQLLGGLQAGAGAALESAFGEGGIGTAIKESGLERYKKWEDKIQAGSRESDSWDYSWEQATENGDRGALAKWIAHGIGYTGGQGLQMLLGAGVGTIAGKAALGKVAQTVANGMVRREAGQIAAATAAKELGETATKEAIAAKAAELALLPELQKEAVKAAAGTIGRNAVIGASAFGQEAGEIFGDLTQKAQEEGRTLTGSELGRAFWSSVAAGGLEFVGDKLSLNVMLGKSRVLKGAQYAEGLGGRAARAALGSVAIAPAEAATEYFQTGLEEYGKGTEQNIIPAFQSEAGQKQAREAAMLGGLGGLVMGGAGGALHGPRPRPTARDILASTSVDDAIGTFVDSLGQSNAPMAGKPLTGRELRAANAGVLDYVRALDPGEQAEALRLLADVQNPNLPAGPKRFAQDRLGELFASVHKIPVGEVEEVSQIPAGEATEVMRDAIAADRAMDEFRSKYAEQLPIGEATDVVPEEVSPAPPAENRTPRVSTAAKELDFSGTTAMVKTFVDRMAAIGTPAARAFVSDYRAGRISDDDVFRAMSASEWVSPDQRISEASEALARAAAKRAPSAQPSDLLAPGDVPYRTKLSAMLRAKHEGLDNSTVVPAPDGGFVVRPREGVGHDAQGDQQGAGGTDVPRHIDAGRGGSADRGGIGIAGRGDTGVVEREGIHGGGTTDVGAVGAEQLTSQAASEATHATDQIAEQQSAGGEHRIGDQGRAAGEAGGGDRVQRAEAGQEAAAAQVAEDREFLRAFQDRKPSDASPSEAEIARAAEVRDRLASESLSALDGGATFKNAGIRFEADGDTHVVMTHDGLRLAFIDGARTRANVMTALRAAQLRKSGVSANDAGKQAVRERLESVGTQLETLEQERRKQFSERQQKSAVHVEPGEAPEVVTPAVVTEATKTAAENRNRKPSEMRAELLAMIDAAIPKAKYEDRSQVPRGRAARKTGDDYVRFRIKGDGVFTIMNSQDALREFREKVEKSPGFKDRTPRPTTPTWQTSARHGSSGPESAIKNMIDDGDPQAAVDYAAARGMNLADVLKGDKTRLDKVAGLTPTEAEAVGAFEPEAAEAKQGTTPPAEVGPEYTNAPDAATAQTANDVATGAATNARIENFGEALPPPRRALRRLEDVSEADIAHKPLSELWPQSVNDEIEDKRMAAVAHAMRSAIPSKPRQASKLTKWVKSVAILRAWMQALLRGEVQIEPLMDRLREVALARGLASKIAVLENVDRSQWKRIGNVAEYPQAFKYVDGKKIPAPHVMVEIDGKTRALEGSGSVADHLDEISALLGAKAEPVRMQFEVRGTEQRGFRINKKGDREYRALLTFKTAKDAFAALRDRHDELVQAWERIKERDNVTERDLRTSENRPRTGEDYRHGRDITSAEFEERFGFRGGEFGDWVTQGRGDKDRQALLNSAYDALMDLASILDVPPRAISLDGSLGIAFGSRGSGWASAHFEPNTLVINLTKPRGAGALAHEWFHALDNYFARLRNAGYEVKARSSSEYRDKNYVTHNPEPLMVRKDGTGRPLLRSTLQERKARNPTATYFDEDQWQPDPSHPQGVRPVVERRFAALVDALNAAPFTKRAAHIDSSSGYWSRRLERAARSFEVYIQSRMAQRGFQNDYLVNVTSLEDFKRDPGRYPYPTPEEIEPIAKAFDDLFATIETRETERGVALFSRASEDVRQDSNGARATAIRAAITKAYGGLLDALESRGLVTLTQTLDQAIALAARARSAATGRSVDESRRELMPDANRQTGGASMSDKTQIDPIYSRSGNVEGFHDPVTGKSFLVADNLTEMTAPGTLMHEVGVHMADAGVLEDMMRRGERLIREHSDEPMVRRAIKRMASAGETSPEEFVAYLVTEYENDRVNAPRSVRAFIRDLIAAIRAWLHKQGFVNTGSLTVADIAAIARANARSTASRRGGIGTRQEQGQDIRFSMAPAAQAVKDFTAALRGGSAKRFNALHRTIATQLHKASIDPDYGRVFAIGQEFERDIARATARAAALAPDVLPAFDNAKSAFWRVVHGAKGDEEVDKAGQALWAGTLENGPEADSGVVWSDEQLRERFGLGAEGSKLYRQARAAIDASLDETAAAIAFQLVKRNAGDLAGAIMEAPARARELIEERLGSEVTEAAQAYLADAKAMPNASEETKNVAAALKVLDRASALKAGGYAPLMRFGRYAVEVRDRDGTLVDFRKFDSELSAKMAEQRMRRQYPGASIERSVMSEDAWKLFAGVDPETVMLFADHIDGLDNDVKQQWYRAALSERSAMKHLIAPRKGMPGYSADLRRVLSSFIGSSARLAARQMHMGSMKAEISDMIDRKVSGDVIDEAQKLQEYLEAPDEPFKGTRSLMFTWYLGGSVASAAVNLTQPLMMTLPYLSQFGSAGKTMLGAIKESVSGKVNDATLAQALKRASDDGIVDPQTVHHLYHHGMKSLIDALPGGAGAKARAQGFSTLWGLMFGAAENFNRRITFISAYRMALADKTLGDPYAFAARAVEETQSIYSRGNRPNWARGTGAFGALGVAAFTFKQYSIAYVELLVRMAKAGPKGRLAAAAMLGMMALAAGMQGVPFAEDIEDLVDTVAQQLGYRGNTKASIREALIDAFGTGVADAMMYGASAGLPLDVSGRLGLGHLIPAIGIGKLTERDRRGKQLAELAGPIGGFYGSLMDAVEAAGAGKGGGEVIAAFAPIAVRNAMIGAQMAERGYYSDTRGRRVTDTDAGDAFIKALGFQPESVASVRRPQYLVAQDIARMRGVKQDISDLRARAIVEREPDLRVRAEEMLREWNTNNPDMRITINAADIMKRVTAARATSAERIKKTAPQQVRRRVAELLNAP